MLHEEMNYEETLNYLYTSAPLFQNIGAGAYKEGLYNTRVLDGHFNHPHGKYKTIHIAGTNGKGSCAHTIAAVLQSAGYKVGLYTSPHLVDFRERIRIDGKMISKQDVIDFVENERAFFEPLHPSFFELTTALAFCCFAKAKVDIAVVEVGLGGRLDCTNIINPILSVITNISYDHTQFLGNTLREIAGEKAGIIKSGTPVVVGETVEETRCVFEYAAKKNNAPIVFADESPLVKNAVHSGEGLEIITDITDTPVYYELGGDYQAKNANTILWAICKLQEAGVEIHGKDILKGFGNVKELTGLRGRWEIISRQPTVILDTGHNTGGLAYNMRQLSKIKASKIRIVVGMVSDKDVAEAVELMPRDAVYYFTKASVKRALDENVLCRIASKAGLKGKCFATVAEAYGQVMRDASKDDVVYVGGSNFVIADLLGNL